MQKELVSDTNAYVYKDQAIDLALKYSFVTPYTSLVIAKPSEEQAFLNFQTARFDYDDSSDIPTSPNYNIYRNQDIILDFESVSSNFEYVYSDMCELDHVQSKNLKRCLSNSEERNIERNLSGAEDSFNTVEGSLSTLERNFSTVRGNLNTVKESLSTLKQNLRNLNGTKSIYNIFNTTKDITRKYHWFNDINTSNILSRLEANLFCKDSSTQVCQSLDSCYEQDGILKGAAELYEYLCVLERR